MMIKNTHSMCVGAVVEKQIRHFVSPDESSFWMCISESFTVSRNRYWAGTFKSQNNLDYIFFLALSLASLFLCRRSNGFVGLRRYGPNWICCLMHLTIAKNGENMLMIGTLHSTTIANIREIIYLWFALWLVGVFYGIEFDWHGFYILKQTSTWFAWAQRRRER